MKIIKVSTDNIVSIHDYPAGSFREKNTVLAELIGNGCEMIESVKPKRLYEKLKFQYRPTENEGESVAMIVDEEGLLKDEIVVNPIGSYLYEIDKHGCPIVGNILFVGEQISSDGILLCGLSDTNFTKLKYWLDKMVSSLNLDEGGK